MRAVFLGVLSALALLELAMADPADLEGGVFIAHYPAAMQFSSDPPAGGWCQHYLSDYAITSCEEQVTRIDTTGAAIWLVLVAWDEEKEWCGVEFGLGEYSPAAYTIIDHGPCFPGNGLEIPTAGWPGPDEGTGFVITDSSWVGNFVPIYYFAGYAYSATSVPLSTNPATGFGGMASCQNPAAQWAASAFGAMGMFMEGAPVCPDEVPSGSEPRVCCLNGACQLLTCISQDFS